eukprot:8352084-Pyramimonas_sp.AAC.1
MADRLDVARTSAGCPSTRRTCFASAAASSRAEYTHTATAPMAATTVCSFALSVSSAVAPVARWRKIASTVASAALPVSCHWCATCEENKSCERRGHMPLKRTNHVRGEGVYL